MLRHMIVALAPLLLGACGAGHIPAAAQGEPEWPSSLCVGPAGRAPCPIDERRGAAAAGKAAQMGIASWYGPRHHGRATASGARYDMNALTAAHPTLPLGTRVRVVHRGSGRSVVVTVNDRGPHTGNRVIDLSHRAARELGFLQAGIAPVLLLPDVQAVPQVFIAPPGRKPPPLRQRSFDNPPLIMAGISTAGNRDAARPAEPGSYR